VLLDEREPVAGRRAGSVDRSGELGRRLDERQPFLGPDGQAPSRPRGRSRPAGVTAADDPPAGLREPGFVQPLALPELVRSEHGRLREIGCGRPAWAAIRAATPTGQSVPGAIIPSIASAPTRRSIAGSSSVERMQRRSASGKPGAAGSRSTTASQTPRARAASSSPS